MGFKRNIMALLRMALLTGVFAALIVFLGRLVPALFVLPFVCLLGFCGFIYTFAAYPVIQRYIIDPVKKPTAPAVGESAEENA